jgi:hypothetical protein
VTAETLSRNESGRFGALKSDSTHHFFRNACTKSRSLRFSQFSMDEIEIFGTFSGLMINRNKTEGLWIGKLKHSKDKVENIKWTNKPIKSLGIYYKITFYIYHFQPTLLKISYQCISFYLIWFPIP